MRVTLEILDALALYAKERIEDLDEKRLVPDPLQRRRLTRGAKILLFLGSSLAALEKRVVFATDFGEMAATVEILELMQQKKMVSPATFQNSVHNTPPSYLSILFKNHHEMITVSDFLQSGKSAFQVAAMQAIFAPDEEIFVACVDSFDADLKQEMGVHSVLYGEVGVGFRVKLSECDSDVMFHELNEQAGFLRGYGALVSLVAQFHLGKRHLGVLI